MKGFLTIEKALSEFRTKIENAIKENGVKGKESIIRSSIPINFLHNAVKHALINKDIDPNFIFPHINETKPELNIAGFLKQKSQDVCIVPQSIQPKEETISRGLLSGKKDRFGIAYTEQTLAINIRSQISSLEKNFDTMYERTFAEAMNLHLRCPKMVLGELYMIAVPEYDIDAIKEKQVVFSTKKINIEKYIKAFNDLNERNNHKGNEYKYEKVCLLLVDFQKNKVKIHTSNQSLITAGLISDNFPIDIRSMGWNSFVSDLLNIHKNRFKL